MGLDYSYSQPSESQDLFDNSVDSGSSSDLIRRDQAELSLHAPEPVQYPPQPEVEFGFPQQCYCGAKPILVTSNSEWNDLGRRYYTCANVKDGESHVFKWWDEAVMEEMRAGESLVNVLAEKVDNLSLFTDAETAQKLAYLEGIVSEMAREKRVSSRGFGLQFCIDVMIVVLGLCLIRLM